jgi:hypothetical protein
MNIGTLPWVKQREREANHSHSTSVRVKNKYNGTLFLSFIWMEGKGKDHPITGHEGPEGGV